MKKTSILLIISILFFVLAAAIYYAPVSERGLRVSSPVTSQMVDTGTLYTTQRVTSTIQKVSTFTTFTMTGSASTVLDKGYRVWSTGNEFTFLKIKDLKIGDRIDLEIDYPYKTWVQVVDSKGDTAFEVIYDGGELRRFVDVTVEGAHTLWIDTLAAPGQFILRVKVEVAHPVSTSYITERTIEEEQVLTQTGMMVAKSTRTTITESYHTTYTRGPLESRGILTPALIVIGLLIIIYGLFAGKRAARPSEATYCIKCGQALLPEDKFCEKCGSPQTS
jgi:hypothetical protein